MDPTPTIKMNTERRMGCSLMPHGVKFNPSTIRGTIAIERPKPSAILSMMSIPLSVFLAGNSTKMSRYPGMKRRSGRPSMIRTVPSMFNVVISEIMMLHAKQSSISIGYFSNCILIFLQCLDGETV